MACKFCLVSSISLLACRTSTFEPVPSVCLFLKLKKKFYIIFLKTGGWRMYFNCLHFFVGFLVVL